MQKQNIVIRPIARADVPDPFNRIFPLSVLQKASEKYNNNYIRHDRAFGKQKETGTVDESNPFTGKGGVTHKCIAMGLDSSSGVLWASIELFPTGTTYQDEDFVSSLKREGLIFDLDFIGKVSYHEDDRGYKVVDTMEIEEICWSLIAKR